MIVNLLTFLSFLMILFVVLTTGKLIQALLRREADVTDAARESSGGLFVQALAGAIPQLSGEVESIRHDLSRAGNYRRDALNHYLALRNTVIGLTMALTLAAGALAVTDATLLRILVITGTVLTISAYGIPRIVLGWIANRRVVQIQNSLPECLDMIAMSLTGGVPLRDALNQVAVEIGRSNPAVATEFEIIGRQASAGSMGQALRYFAERIDVPDVKSLASIISQTERLGTNVAKAMKDYSDTVRQTHRRRVEERANRVSVQIMLPVIFCLSPPVYLLLCGPPVLELIEHFQGEGFRVDAANSIDTLDDTL
jgi:tight adherence protein C